MTNQQPVLDLLDLVVHDMDATLAFYRRLGLKIPDRAVWRTASGAHRVDLDLSNWFHLHFDSIALAKSFNRGWPEQAGTGTRTIIGSPYHRGRPSTSATRISLQRVTPAANRRTTRSGAPATP